MPTKQLETWAKEAGVTIDVAEKCWENAKKQADHAYPKGEEDEHYWAYVNIRTRECLGLNKNNKTKKKK